jgi:hypothetical protein
MPKITHSVKQSKEDECENKQALKPAIPKIPEKDYTLNGT